MLNVGAQQIEVEVINQTANSRASATRGRLCQVDASAQRFVLLPKIGGSESSKVRDYRQRHLLLRSSAGRRWMATAQIRAATGSERVTKKPSPA